MSYITVSAEVHVSDLIDEIETEDLIAELRRRDVQATMTPDGQPVVERIRMAAYQKDTEAYDRLTREYFYEMFGIFYEEDARCQ